MGGACWLCVVGYCRVVAVGRWLVAGEGLGLGGWEFVVLVACRVMRFGCRAPGKG